LPVCSVSVRRRPGNRGYAVGIPIDTRMPVNGKRRATTAYIMSSMSAPGGIPGFAFFFGFSLMVPSVVIISPATEAAF